MNQNKFSFQSQKLVVDYITFKFQDFQCDQNKIANYFFNLGFNSYQQSGKLANPIQEIILVNSKNQFEILFINDHSYWKGTLLQFSGLNASRFYLLAKQNIIDWQIFDTAVLSRFDLYFQRELKETDQISTKDFLSNCQQKLKKKIKILILKKIKKVGF